MIRANPKPPPPTEHQRRWNETLFEPGHQPGRVHPDELHAGRLKRAAEIIAEARALGQELMEVWE